MSTLEKAKALSRKEAREKGPVTASLRYLPMSARKVRVIADAIRNKPLQYALEFLSAQKRACSAPLKKLLESAMANADVKNVPIDDLNISEIQVDKGPLRKRFMPRAQGRATKIRKQTSHVKVVVIPAV